MDPGLAPVIVLVVVTATLFVLGKAGVRRLTPWPVAVRGGVAALFVTTGLAHFIGMRAELVAMVPPALPAPELLVTVTGVLELAGAVGLLWSRTVPLAAAGLTAMLIGMFPANVHHALNGADVTVLDQLLPRSVMQLVFLAGPIAILVAWLSVRRSEERTEENLKSFPSAGSSNAQGTTLRE